MTEIHSCSYYCERPECIKAQRDELRERLAQPEQDAVLAEREACAEVAEEWQLGVDDPRYQKSCADAIRARGNT